MRSEFRLGEREKAEELARAAAWRAETIFVNNWLQIAVVAAVIGAVFGYLWWQGQIKRLRVYCQETWVELQKCAWPTRDELKGSTALIMVMVAMLGIYIYVIDTVFYQVFFHK
jgi:preprotein translocase SecE subunit